MLADVASVPGRPPLRFGISVVPLADTYSQIVEQVVAADRMGLELVGIQDHPYQRRFLDTFALIGDLLARTSNIRIFPDVTSLPMRPPAMIAKAAASLDVMSGGRFELGLGGGGFWEAVAGMGGTVRVDGERLPALDEALGIIRSALDVGAERRVVRSAGDWYPAHRYPAGPPPAHRVEIWIGAMSPGALRLIGRFADGWVPGGGMSQVADFPRSIEVIDAAAVAAGRDPSTIRRVVNLSGVIGEGAGATDSRYVPGAGVLNGPPSQWIDTLSDWATRLGIDSFVLWPSEPTLDQIERFANEVTPAFEQTLR
jgi:alkanesulfonate monooxygenase SsuD/methylene tetrahydromethanopterin reductase-like flavin-dependent oxidoreductase (luciferase family)